MNLSRPHDKEKAFGRTGRKRSLSLINRIHMAVHGRQMDRQL